MQSNREGGEGATAHQRTRSKSCEQNTENPVKEESFKYIDSKVLGSKILSKI